MVKNYLMKVFDGMAKGLFASLIIGVIIKQIGTYAGITALVQLGQMAQYLMGPAIGVGIAVARGAKPLTIFSAAVAGLVGAGAVKFSPEGAATIAIGEPVGALVASLVGIEIGKFLEGRTKFDILLIPLSVVLGGGLVGIFISPTISRLVGSIGIFINELTLLHPLPMGILLGIFVGMILTLPISSAALCIAIGIGDIAAGAALAGCCAQMIGFAVISFRDNRLSGAIAQGLGTSMLQVPNIIKNPFIWVPPTIAGGICGALATMVFKMKTTAVGAGMGSSGLVGQLTTLSEMGASSIAPIIILHFIAPAVLSYGVYFLMRKKGLIKDGDMTI